MQVTNLRSYLAQVGMTMKEFSEKIGCSRTYLSKLVSGETGASLRLSKDIFEATGGLIRIPTRKEMKNYKKLEQESKKKHEQALENAIYKSVSLEQYEKMMTHYDAFDEHKQD